MQLLLSSIFPLIVGGLMGAKHLIRPNTIAIYLLACAGFITHDIRILFVLWLTTQALANSWNIFQKSTLRNPQIFFVTGICLFTFLKIVQDIGSYDISLSYSLSEWTIAALLSMTFIGICPFPWHRNVLRELRGSDGLGYLLRRTSPLSPSMPILIMHPIGNTLSGSLSPIAIACATAVCLAFYFILASFEARGFSTFLYYVYTSLTLVFVSTMPFLSTSGTYGASFLIASTSIGIASLAVCLDIYNKRYGWRGIQKPYMGLQNLHKSVGYIFLFYVFMLSNAPFGLSFIGEDLLTYDVFSYSKIYGVCCLGVIGLAAISLYRYYGLVFGGEVKSNYPHFPLLKNEKLSLSTLFITAICMPFLHLL